jgi:sulfate adenylyltransferase subunit 1
MELLRFFTAGNVDDGKSTLIGRLLLDSHVVSTDIIETLTRQSASTGEHATIDLALLTDGLRAEREQGITIDVAYKYFSTDKRKFIIADTPGHVQYTRNMFTGASTAQVALLLVDARIGISEQTKRHCILAGTLGIPHVLVCINKMDLVNYDQSKFDEIRRDFELFAQPIDLKNTAFIPVSALVGDNVVAPSTKMPWYTGKSLFQYLETVELVPQSIHEPVRFQIQYVIRPQSQEYPDYRGYAGTMMSGKLSVGDQIVVLPNELETQISRIEKNQQEVQSAEMGEPVVLHFSNQVGASRGEMVVLKNQLPKIDKTILATICWMDTKDLIEGQKFIFQQKCFRTKAVVKALKSKIDIHTYEKHPFTGPLKLNELAIVEIKTADPVCYDSFNELPHSGSFILIHENTHQTVAGGTIH